MLQTGDIIDRFTIEGVLGQGGMAVVYRVSHQTLGSQHALKVLTVGSKAITERMLQEGRVQASLRHPNVVAVHDVLDIGGQPGLLMEYVDGPSLDGFLIENPHPDPELAFELFMGTLAAVAHAHEHGLVHRDLKPGNILLQQVAGRWIPKVTDFGLAKLVEGDQNLSKTRSGVAMGTPSYMSPEQIRDAKSVDARGDVFALGCVLYELYTGEQAFYGEDILEIFNKVATGDYPAPREVNPEIPDRVVAAIEGALRIRKEDRIPNCAMMREVLLGHTTQWSRRRTSQETFVADEVVANPTILPESAPVASPFGSGSDLGDPSTAVARQDTVVRSPRAHAETVLEPVDAEAPFAPQLTELGISQTTMEPYPGARPSSSPLLLVVGVGLLVMVAMVLGGALTAKLVTQAVEERTPITAPVPEPAPEPAPEPEPAPVPEPAPAPELAPAPEPVVQSAPVPAPVAAKPRLATKYAGIAGADRVVMTIDHQSAAGFDATVTIRGRQVGFSGTLNGDAIHFIEVGGPMVFRGQIREDGRLQGTWTRTEGAAGAQWFLQPR